MLRIPFLCAAIACGLAFPLSLFAYTVEYPEEVMQGEPLLVTFSGANALQIAEVQLDDQIVKPFYANKKVHALFGIDLTEKPGKHTLLIKEYGPDTVYKKEVTVALRVKPVASFTIPSNLGGNTKQGEKKVIANLTEDNKVFETLKSNPSRLWRGPFGSPLRVNVITDTFGYLRVSGGTVITHKGVDFRAPVGTPVYAMNRGVVIFSKKLATYGNTVMIDHGEGLITMYMHLDKRLVVKGNMIQKGEELGLSGQTGYANGPHLHLSIHIAGRSVDPMTFMKYMGER